MLRIAPLVRRLTPLPVALLVAACPIDDRLLVAEQADAGSGDARGKAGKGGLGASSSGGEAGLGGADADAASDAATTGGTGGVGASGGVGGGSGGTSGAGAGGTGGTAASGGGAGAGGGGSGGTGQITDCPDLDGNQVSDCDESLVSNPDFDVTEAGWQKEENQTQTWESTDANAVSLSGSLSVTNTTVMDHDGIAMAGTTQCLPAAGATNYGIFGQILVKSAPGGAAGAINVLFFDTEGCTGKIVASYTSPQAGLTEVWDTVEGGTLAPTAAKAMRVRLVTIKPFRQPAAQAFFDNVLIRAR